jgi:sarcosine oxidase delta subunit
MATKVKAHKSVKSKTKSGARVVCPHCGKKHTKSQHLSHGKGSFSNFPSRAKKTKETKKLTKAQFLRRMNKGRKAKGLPPIKAKK